MRHYLVNACSLELVSGVVLDKGHASRFGERVLPCLAVQLWVEGAYRLRLGLQPLPYRVASFCLCFCLVTVPAEPLPSGHVTSNQ